MLFVRMCPNLLLGALSGAISERINRKRLLAGGLALVTLVSLGIGGLALGGHIELWHIAVAAFLSGVFWTIEFPTRRTLLGEIARMDRIGSAMGLDSGSNHATRMLGPALGGYLLEQHGLAAPYLLGACLYGLACLNIATLSFRPASETTSGESLLRIIADGVRYIRTNRLVTATLVVTMLVNFFGFSYGSMLPVIGEVKLGLSALPIGILASMEGVGAVLGAAAIAFYSRPDLFPRIYAGGSALFLAMILAFSFSSAFAPSLPLLFLGGIGMAGFGAMQSAIVFTATAPAMRRRVMGVLVACIGAGPLGVLHTGLIADWSSADLAIRIAALEGLLALGLCAWVWPELWRLGSDRS
jgi:MFS family permease